MQMQLLRLYHFLSCTARVRNVNKKRRTLPSDCPRMWVGYVRLLATPRLAVRIAPAQTGAGTSATAGPLPAPAVERAADHAEKEASFVHGRLFRAIDATHHVARRMRGVIAETEVQLTRVRPTQCERSRYGRATARSRCELVAAFGTVRRDLTVAFDGETA